MTKFAKVSYHNILLIFVLANLFRHYSYFTAWHFTFGRPPLGWADSAGAGVHGCTSLLLPGPPRT